MTRPFTLRSFDLRKTGIAALIGALAAGPLLAAIDAAHTAPSAGARAAVPTSQGKEGQFEATVGGTNRQRLAIGKIDPPAAFNLEDIQNFPEERLHPVLNNPITFEEGRDFSILMDSLDERIFHPWLPEIPKAPYLVMKTEIDKQAKDWTFSVIDQGGGTVFSQSGRGNPPSTLSWNGEDKNRGILAVDTVYIPQLSITSKEGYRHTYPGQPVQFAVLFFKDKNKTTIELSAKRLFAEKKAELTKEAPTILDKVGDLIREDSRLSIAIQAYDVDPELGMERTRSLQNYFARKLFLPESTLTVLQTTDPEKRGNAMAVVLSGGTQ